MLLIFEWNLSLIDGLKVKLQTREATNRCEFQLRDGTFSRVLKIQSVHGSLFINYQNSNIYCQLIVQINELNFKLLPYKLGR